MPLLLEMHTLGDYEALAQVLRSADRLLEFKIPELFEHLDERAGAVASSSRGKIRT